MDSDEETALAVVSLVLAPKIKNKKKRKKRIVWVKPWLQRRSYLGCFDTLLKELRSKDEAEYKRFLRMTPQIFDELLELVEEDITKENTRFRDAIPTSIKLAITIKFLATGMSYSELAYQFRVHKSTIAKFVPEVCEVIYNRLKEDYMKVR